MIETCESLEDLRRRAPELAEISGRDPFVTLSWFELLDRYGFDRDVPRRFLLARTPGGRPLLALPLALRDGLESLSNFYSGLYAPIGTTPDATMQRSALAAMGDRLRADRVARIRLAPLDATGPFLRDMRAALQDAGFWTDTYFCFGNWHLPVRGMSFDAYAQTLPGHVRTTIERRSRRLSRAGRWRVVIHRQPGADLEDAIAAFEAVYRKSWKVPEPFPRFMPELCRLAASAGWLRLGVLSLEGRPLAAQVWLHAQDRAMIFKLAYDAEHAQFSAGTLLTAALMRNALDVDRVQEVDYLSGDDPYKRDWMPCRRERLGIVAFNPRSARGLLGAARHFAARAARRLRPGGHSPRAPRA